MNPNQNDPQPQMPVQQPIIPAQPPMQEPTANVVYPPSAAPRKSPKNKILLLIAVVLLLALGTGAYVFGYYLPNKPQNVWNTGLSRTGDALAKTTTSLTEKNKLESFTKSQITASAEFTSDEGYSGSGSLKTTFDDNKTIGNLDFTLKTPNQPDRVVSAKSLAEVKKGSLYPNLYFQLSGLKTLGIEQLETYFPGISEYDGKWIAIEEDYIKSIADATLQSPTSQTPRPTDKKKDDPVSADDVAELAQAVSRTVSEYMLTTSPDKAVFEQRKFVGKETLENNVKTYHYEVSIHKAHAKDACKVMIERVWATKIYKKMPGSEVDQEAAKKQKDTAIKQCQESVDNDIKQDETFDVWIDTTYKLVHKFRVYEDDKKSYTDIGQTYKAGHDIKLFVTSRGDEDSNVSTFTLDTNIKTNETKANLTIKSTKKDDKYDFSATLEAKPFKEEIKIEKPAGAIPIKSIFDRYEIDPIGILSLAGYQAGAMLNDESAQDLPATYQN